MVTIRDVASKASVSTATVSRVINRPEMVDEATRMAVLATISELRYRPNQIARGLASQTSRTVGIVINLFSSRYYGLMLDGAEHALRECGFHALVESSGETASGEERAWESLMQRQCDALIVHSDLLSDSELDQRMREHPTAVLMNRHLKSFEQRCVYLDNELGGALAAQYLLSHGHRRLAMITGPNGYLEAQDRSKGFCGVLEKNGLSLEAKNVQEATFVKKTGYAAMNRLLDSGADFTAVFCQNDYMAGGAFEACHQRNVRIPEDLSIIGFDDMDITTYLNPKLTSIRQPLISMGEASAKLAHALATGAVGESTSAGVLFEPTLIERESVASPPPG